MSDSSGGLYATGHEDFHATRESDPRTWGGHGHAVHTWSMLFASLASTHEPNANCACGLDSPPLPAPDAPVSALYGSSTRRHPARAVRGPVSSVQCPGFIRA
ncbi:hypothetical protein PAAG_11881 [Paracoccidioides lutzii Pb01]|uniref:Uncharacterized protein n=1 Tax=Paracoccidioides lutzii (strain ATCC MYA-826 / Pb01) TaxID=502779 RepID=A0A0A2V4X2_PARBA|nr:hypothetical protein PAAG_11881 [Paracoccidioides lutzii Pb01]KGQ01417.1 hypothetical protein PAAG_11881 [Paracoccidioides lutzii Pb01]